VGIWPTCIDAYVFGNVVGEQLDSTTRRDLAVTPAELQRSMLLGAERQCEQAQQRRLRTKQARTRAWERAARGSTTGRA
jgi:hypothetical protein